MRIVTTHGEACPIVSAQLALAGNMLLNASRLTADGLAKEAYKAVTYELVNRAMQNLEEVCGEEP